MRRALQGVPPMLGAQARELATMPILAMLAGDWPTAEEAARQRLARHPDDEGALVALSVALWELGREAEAREVVALNGAGGPGPLRAAVRFYHHIDEPAGAQVALDALGEPAPALAIGLGHAWRRHGEFERALAEADRVLAALPGSHGATALQRAALAEQRVLDGAWRPAPLRRPVTPVAGRVLHMLQRSLPQHRSGSTYRTHYTTQAQLAAGLDPAVLTEPGFPTATPALETETVEGVPHHRLARGARPAAPLDERLGDYLRAASPVVERVRPAVLHPASDYRNALVAIELGRRHALPVVYEVRGFPEIYQGRWAGSRTTFEKARWRRHVEAECWRQADRVVTLAEVMKGHIVDHGVAPERVVVVPNAVDVNAFRPEPPDPALRERLGIEPQDLVAGYVSTLVGYEGVRFLVEAVARLTARGRPVRALIVGDGPERRALAQLARRLGVADRVLLPGRVAHGEVLAYYALMDVFVVPRTDEPTTQLVTPLKPYEAMACGKAVVVSRTAALQEMIHEGETGLSFAPEDAADLAQVLERLAADPEGRVALGRRARGWVVANRTWAANAARYGELYGELGAV